MIKPNSNPIDNIIEGWKFELIIEREIINISEEIRIYISDRNILKISDDFSINKFLKRRIEIPKNFYWRISNKYNKKWMPITILGGTPYTLDLNKNLKKPSLKIVYFINSDISCCYLNLMKDQLNNFIKSKIFTYSDIKLFLVIICSVEERKKDIFKLLDFKKLKEYVDYEIKFSNDNHKEFEGIKKVWEISKKKSNENDLILYLHAKGISYMQNNFFYFRQPLEKMIFKLLVGQWENNIELLIRLNSIYKLGTLTGGNGWLWFNFWIVKASYISKLEKPIKRNRACYYEDWLGRYLIKNKIKKKHVYINDYNELFLNTINNTLSLLSKPSKNKFNIGTPCRVEKGGFVGLGIVKLKYRLWYYFFVIINKLGINEGNKDRFKFY